jgi:hypothetical protein
MDRAEPNRRARAPLLTPAEQQGLRDKMAAFIKSNDAYDRATAVRDREKDEHTAREGEGGVREGVDKQMEKARNLLASMPVLRAIYDNCFLLDRPEFSLGNLRAEKPKGDGKGDVIEYSFFLPKTYKAEKPMRAVIVLPGTAAAGAPAWAKREDYFAAVWDKTTALNDTIFEVCHVPAGL